MLLLRVVTALNEAKVKYAVAGGYAVALHGAVRGTVDVDLVIGLTKGDYVAAEGAMRSIGFEPRLPVSAEEVFDFRDEYRKNKNLVAWSFFNPKNPLEIVDIVITHDLKKLKSIAVSLGKTPIRILSIESLIAMKEESGRPQDREDIKALERLRK
ncbi:MAG: nucleotidyltransferase [Bdellovibrionales bacterium]|nr:nucleotidyltransferase [Bdellovibrionales bacterium]